MLNSEFDVYKMTARVGSFFALQHTFFGKNMMLYLILNQEARTRRTDRRTAIASATMVMNASTVHAKFLLHRFQYHSIRRQNFKNSPTAINHVVWFQGLKLIFRCDFDFWGLGF